MNPIEGNIEIPVLFEDNDYIVINKPAGLVVHADGRTIEPSVASWVALRHPEMIDVGEPLVLSSGIAVVRPGIVHRLDRETSGALILAKNQNAFLHLKQQFQDRLVGKLYHTFVHGSLKEDEGEIARPIGKSSKDFRRWSAQPGARGELREALTLYRVLGRGKDTTFVEVEPKTGRTHQIRVHFKAIHHPVVGDKLYAENQPKRLGFDRTALHAHKITFLNVEGKSVSVEAPYPPDFVEALEKFNNLQ
jgi:23S rRNA pseudouridine1911/1915/1917 synthase